MNHESNKSPSLGMISTATRNTATVSPLSPLTNGNAVTQSANSGFAAALRKLAKQAEDPRGKSSQPSVTQSSRSWRPNAHTHAHAASICKHFSHGENGESICHHGSPVCPFCILIWVRGAACSSMSFTHPGRPSPMCRFSLSAKLS